MKKRHVIIHYEEKDEQLVIFTLQQLVEKFDIIDGINIICNEGEFKMKEDDTK